MTRMGPDQGSVRIEDYGRRLYLRWFVKDSDRWRAVLDDFKAFFPHHSDRNYSPDTKYWSVPAWHRDRLGRWLDRWFTVAAQHWDDEDDDIDDEPDDKAGPPAMVAAAYQTLHLLPSAPAEVVTAAHRAMTRLTHPDAGGSHEASVAVNVAIERIRAHQSRRAS